MHPVFAPGTCAAVVEAAEEAGAVLSVQTLVGEAVLLVVRHNVVHLQQGGARPQVHAGAFVLWSQHVASAFESDSISDRRKMHLSRDVPFGLLGLPVAGEVVKGAVLHQSGKGEDEADGDKEVHGSDVGDLW